jgi:hypothetical protein
MAAQGKKRYNSASLAENEERPMKTIAELAGQELKWVQPSALKMRYELRAGDMLAAALHFRSSFGSFATGESADGCWTFKRVGFLQTRVTIRACGQDNEIAVFKNNTWSGGGTLELPGGKKLLASTNLWQSKLEFETEAGDKVLEFNSGGVIHLSATVGIQPEAFRMAELPWIVMLGWYLVVMMYMDSAASAAIIG